MYTGFVGANVALNMRVMGHSYAMGRLVDVRNVNLSAKKSQRTLASFILCEGEPNAVAMNGVLT